MEVKLFSFTKTEKHPQTIEDKINSFLEEGNAFKIACQSESSTKGKFFLSLFYEKKKTNIRVKVFKDIDHRKLEKDLNSFLEGDVNVKWTTQSSTTSNIYMVVFYESRKTKDEKEQENKDRR